MLQRLWNGKLGVLVCLKCENEVGYKCDGGDFCPACCKETKHGHCKQRFCSVLPVNKRTGFCPAHHRPGKKFCATPHCPNLIRCDDLCRHCCTEFHDQGDGRYHCISFGCFYPTSCGMLCKICCDDQTHGHCIAKGCYPTKTCEDFCKAHCTETTHDHCRVYGCNVTGRDGLCKTHCTSQKHRHCANGDCGEIAVCNSFCTSHCTVIQRKRHVDDHCLADGCSRSCEQDFCFQHIKSEEVCAVKECSEKVTCGRVCYHHCTERSHGHCPIMECGGKLGVINPKCEACRVTAAQ